MSFLNVSKILVPVVAGLTLATCVACSSLGSADTGPVPSPASSVGNSPTMPEPEKKLIPVVQVAPATGWSAGAKPTPAPQVAVNAFASGLDHPRWIYVLPNGDVLVAETNAPERPEDGKGIKGTVMKSMR